MRTISILIYLLFFCLDYSTGQRKDTVYLDKNRNETKSKNFKYYRIAIEDSGLIKVIDYYRSGKIHMTGTYKSINFNNPTGQFFNYKKNGHILQQIIYESFKYTGLLTQFKNYLNLISPLPDSNSIWINYRKGRTIWGIGYVSDSCSCKSRFLYLSKRGDLYFQMSFINNQSDGRYIHYYYNKVGINGQYKAGKKNGEWVFYDQDSRIYKKVNYLSGKVIQ